LQIIVAVPITVVKHEAVVLENDIAIGDTRTMREGALAAWLSNRRC
jgi:hypothetical protein